MTLDEVIEQMQERGWTWDADDEVFTHPDVPAAITVAEAIHLLRGGPPTDRPDELGR